MIVANKLPSQPATSLLSALCAAFPGTRFALIPGENKLASIVCEHMSFSEQLDRVERIEAFAEGFLRAQRDLLGGDDE